MSCLRHSSLKDDQFTDIVHQFIDATERDSNKVVGGCRRLGVKRRSRTRGHRVLGERILVDILRHILAQTGHGCFKEITSLQKRTHHLCLNGTAPVFNFEDRGLQFVGKF